MGGGWEGCELSAHHRLLPGTEARWRPAAAARGASPPRRAAAAHRCAQRRPALGQPALPAASCTSAWRRASSRPGSRGTPACAGGGQRSSGKGGGAAEGSQADNPAIASTGHVLRPPLGPAHAPPPAHLHAADLEAQGCLRGGGILLPACTHAQWVGEWAVMGCWLGLTRRGGGAATTHE